MDDHEPQLRTDWLTGRSVFVAESRALRPSDFADDPYGVATSAAVRATTDATSPACPFCAGNESRTPPPVYEKHNPTGNWQVRIIPNKFPAVMPPPAAIGAAVANSSQFQSQTATPAIGIHEVIIESPHHIARLSVLSVDELQDVLEAYAYRLRHWRASNQFQYGLVFKNQGLGAGASIVHLHSQLVALPFVPAPVAAEQLRAGQSFSQSGSCPYCDLIATERVNGERIVSDRDGLVAFCPFASMQPGEVWLMPAGHQPSFESADTAELKRLARTLHPLICRIEEVVPGAAYNMLLRTSPWTTGSERWSHWRIELMPRTSAFAGLELATLVYINHLPPERAAQTLRLH